MNSTILHQADQRGIEQGMPYTGAVTPQEAYKLLRENPKVMLVDVRTTAERDWVGRVQIEPEQHHAVQWNLYPGGTPNPHFMAELQAAIPYKDTVILFLCRSGVRSRHGAQLATENGYEFCYDILQGFEGDKDAYGHRKTLGGWCNLGLPWVGA